MKKKEELSWAEIKAMYAETDRQFKDIAKRFKENSRQIKENAIQSKETDKKFDRLEKMIERTNQQIGGISRSNGKFCEEYFINSFKENPTFLGEKFERVVEYLKPDPVVVNDEYDLVLRNGKTVVLIEMKYKAGTDDVGKMFSKLNSYRANYPMFKDYKIYLCLASFRFPAKVRECAAKDGIVLIQQRGDKIEVISENVRTW
ncbi:MAG: hypothetical protein FWF70_00180 [Bacteroidetes bacterium]|nr:hypothetical protein [Bacteroidota bacterium]MCL1969713.1 hypothetical protein [Bacteroidota bacterium]